MAQRKKLTVDVLKTENGYEISFQLPPEVIFTQALHRGFDTVGQTARVHLDSTATLENAKSKDWLIHHRDGATASPEKVLAQVRDAMKRWLGELGYEIEFRQA